MRSYVIFLVVILSMWQESFSKVSIFLILFIHRHNNFLWCIIMILSPCNTFIWLQPSAKADHVKVTLYYEALCGGCHDWILNEMFPTYQKIGKYMEVDFVPYGNAHVYIYSTNLIIPRLFSYLFQGETICICLNPWQFNYSNIKTVIVGKLHANMGQKNVKEISNSHACFITLKASKILMLTQYIVLRALVISLMMRM